LEHPGHVEVEVANTVYCENAKMFSKGKGKSRKTESSILKKTICTSNTKVCLAGVT